MHAAALNYFREVVRTGSVRKAAAVLNVASSAVNRQILKLETEFGARLFDRQPSGMRLTLAGELLLRHVAATLHDFDRVRAEIDDLKAARSGHVSIAAMDSLLVDFLPRAIDRFRLEFPAVSYTVLSIQPTDVPQQVADGLADFGFTFVSQVPPSVHFEAEIPAPIGVVMPAEHPLALQASVDFDAVRRFPLLAQSDPLPRSADIDPDFARFRAEFRPKLVSNSIQMLKVGLRLNQGIAFFTRLGFLQEIESGELAWRPFKSPAINQLKLGMLTPSSRSLSPPAQQLARSLAEDLRRFAGP
ncbi:MAG TPA: LysR family transcriptional regulator [Microvirga sp.]|nr:LysR family transcriptional regulator [Microvirga sp.]